jgi:mannan endo-1,4-beta-mannosidase
MTPPSPHPPLPAPAPAQLAQAPGGGDFVRVTDGDFVVGRGCEPFPVSGANVWELGEMLAGLKLTGSELRGGGAGGPALALELLDAVAGAGMTLVRAWAHPVETGADDEAFLRGLDAALEAIRARGLKVILSLGSNWTPVYSPDAFAAQAGVSREAFFTDAGAKKLYKEWISKVVGRTSTASGMPYAEDDSIFAWGLMNEPRCDDRKSAGAKKCAAGTVAAWVSEMGAHVKGLDPNHMVTIGEEGFYAGGAGAGANPPGGWATTEGQDFVADHEDDNIDFATFHAWPTNWGVEGGAPAFLRAWIDAHVADAAALGKPLIFEEFGAEPGSGRAAAFEAAYSAVEASRRVDGALKGALYWQLYADAQVATPGERAEFGDAGRYGVKAGDAVYKVAVGDAGRAAERAKAGGGCGARAPAVTASG